MDVVDLRGGRTGLAKGVALGVSEELGLLEVFE